MPNKCGRTARIDASQRDSDPQRRPTAGLTMIEAVVAASLAMLVLAVLALLATRIFALPREHLEQAQTTESARNLLRRMSTTIRNAQNLDVNRNGRLDIPPDLPWLVIARDYETAVFTNVDADSDLERVRYVTTGTTLQLGIIQPVGINYPENREEIATISNSLHNIARGVPLFAYTINHEDRTTSVQITLIVDADPNQEPAEARAVTKVAPRQGYGYLLPSPPPPVPEVELDGAHDVYLVGNLAYVLATDDDGLDIIDVSDPTNPTHLGSIDDTLCGPACELDGAHDIQIVGQYAYIASYDDNGVEILNISNPANPTHVASIDDAACDAANGGRCELGGAVAIEVVGQFVYVAGWDDDGVEILEIPDLANPTLIHKGSIDDALCGSPCELDGAHDIQIVGQYAYVSSTGDDGVEILDIFNPTSPTHKASIDDDTCGLACELIGAEDIHVVGQFAYVASILDDGVEILEIPDLANPTLVHRGSIDDAACDAANGGRCELSGAEGIHVVGQYAYVSSTVDDGVEILDISTPATPTHVGSIDDAECGYRCQLDGAHEIYVSGDHAYIPATDDDGLEILDISTPATPTHVGSINDT